VCDKVLKTIDYKMVALENPYCNLFFHKECVVPVTKEFVIENYDKIMKYDSGIMKGKKKRKKDEANEVEDDSSEDDT